jgi:hypothetical protein
MGGYGSASLSYSLALRRELSERNQNYARAHGTRPYLSYGEVPTVLFEADADLAQHGNFLLATYRAILQNPSWTKRLYKAHPQARTCIPRNECGAWYELDSCNSSDALLMNVFCHPETFADGRVCSMLGVEPGSAPEFGVKARVPLADGKFDRTEVDMRLGNLLVEAKLTESDFQQKNKAVVEGYRDFRAVFERKALPQTKELYLSYQLIRNVLAAHVSGCAFCVLADQRRPDLIEAWYAVMCCVRTAELRVRCKVLTWQELSEALPPEVRVFLAEKYGIGGDTGIGASASASRSAPRRTEAP